MGGEGGEEGVPAGVVREVGAEVTLRGGECIMWGGGSTRRGRTRSGRGGSTEGRGMYFFSRNVG